MPRTLYLIDAYAQIFRAYYAIRGGMRSPVTGEPTQATFGFANMMMKLLRELKPDFIAVAADLPGGTFRDEIYLGYEQLRSGVTVVPGEDGAEPGEGTPTTIGAQYTEYKGNRDATPDDLISQVPRIFEMLDLLNVPVVGQQGIEADDVIATIVTRVLNDPDMADVNIRIVSKDKDLEQLICDRVCLFDIHTDAVVDAAALWENKGIKPEQVIDVLALMGDTSDNVPGIEGIGLKTAAQLIQQFGSIEGILENIDQIKGKRRENILKGKYVLPISRALVTLKTDADFEFPISAAAVRLPDQDRLMPLFEQLGFRRLQDEIKKLVIRDRVETEYPITAQPAAPATPAGMMDGVPYETAEGGDYRAVTTLDELHKLAKTLREYPIIAVDSETTGLERSSRITGLSFSWKEGQGVYVPTLSPTPEAHLNTETVLSALGPILEDPTVEKCGHNLKFDAGILLGHGIRLRGVVFDTLLASIMIDPARPAHKLDAIAQSDLYYQMIPITDLIGTGDSQITMDQVPLEKIVTYAAEDTDIALRLYHKMLPQIKELGMEALMREMEAPLSVVLAEMERAGIYCDTEELKRQGEVLADRVKGIKAEIYSLCGEEFLIESTQQLGEMLFDKLGFESGKKTKTGRSTDASVLEKLVAQEDRNVPLTAVPRLVLEYRQLTKLISTYLGNLQASVDKEDLRIHTTFHQLVTATGRLASQNPNLQNIPVRSDAGRLIRKAFKAPENKVLICADYSQVELRVLAHLSEDRALIQAFDDDLDIHAAVASQVFGVPISEVSREQRSRAKTINFGIIYGITPFGLSRRIEGLSVSAAAELIDMYRQNYPGIHAFLMACVDEAMDTGKVRTVSGRARAIPEIHSNNRVQRGLGERLAINTVVQGSAADLIKAAMVNLQNKIVQEELPMRLLLQIHDELVLEAPAEEAEACAATICTVMEQAMMLRVPLKAEAGTGADWFSAK